MNNALHFVPMVEPIGSNVGAGSGCVPVATASKQRPSTERRRALDAHRERLRASEEFNRRILESSPDCIKVLSLDARIEFFSAGGLCAMEVDDFDCQLRGAAWVPFWTAEDQPKVQRAIETALAGRTGRFQAFCPTAKGTPKWWDVSVSPIAGADGAPEKLLSISRDITERKRAEQLLRESAERLRIATEAAAVGIWDYDLASEELRWDTRTKAFFGLPPDAPVAWDVFIAGLHPADRPHVEAAVEAALVPHGHGEYDIEYRTVGLSDGIERWIAAKGKALFYDGKPVRFIGSSVDITERKRSERALREADSRKDEFLAMLAHELRNPLAPVLNAARLLERCEPLTDTGQRAVQMIERQTRHMKRLVDDLLEISRITRGAIELRPEKMLLGAAIQNVVEAVLPAFDAKRQRLETVLPLEPVRLVADSVRIAQILENLLTNASKYTPEGGRVRIEVADDDASVTIRVVDNGIGIESDKLEQVFGLFVQAEPSVGEHQGGLGIGLAMVRRLVEMHGGSVHAESAGRALGSTFTVRLPKNGMQPQG